MKSACHTFVWINSIGTTMNTNINALIEQENILRNSVRTGYWLRASNLRHQYK